ncbi:hypothetical protein SAMN05216506_113159 [Saccharopolyspora kobensis]|uniref:Uncharacterized protein n=1 Tax=Saccharopolyspora kobensis TaxID=146035 RepID=A0ABY1E4J3_9PSEU|nr:hypothetical protein SAMN05216506_113159 [Saccharopolyspora kobensis]
MTRPPIVRYRDGLDLLDLGQRAAFEMTGAA